MTKRTWIWTPVTVVAIALASYLLYLALRPPAPPPGLLYGNGHIEGTEVAVSAEVSGRVVESPIEEGQKVAAGALLARLGDAAIFRRGLPGPMRPNGHRQAAEPQGEVLGEAASPGEGAGCFAAGLAWVWAPSHQDSPQRPLPKGSAGVFVSGLAQQGPLKVEDGVSGCSGPRDAGPDGAGGWRG